MEKQAALKVILAVSVAGMLFSGYLSFSEVVLGVCALGGGCALLLGVPTCVYGFAMYTLIFSAALLGIRSKN
jgi:hypothetical protein